MEYPGNANLTADALTAASAAVEAATFRRRDYPSLWQTLSDMANVTIEGGDADQGAVLWLLADACSMRLEPDDGAVLFIPVMGPGGQRSALPDDWSDEERAFLAQAYSEVAHPMLRARLADLAWHVAKPRHADHALAAIDAYRRIPITWDRWLADGRECWARAIQLALTPRKAGKSVLTELEGELSDAFSATGVDDAALPLWIAELVDRQPILRDHRTAVAEHLAALAEQHAVASDPRLAQELLLMAECIYRADRDEERSHDIVVLLAPSVRALKKAFAVSAFATSSRPTPRLESGRIRNYQLVRRCGSIRRSPGSDMAKCESPFDTHCSQSRQSNCQRFVMYRNGIPEA